MTNYYNSQTEIEKVVSDFEACRTAKDQFHHAHHLVVATSYLHSSTIEEATRRIRTALHRFLDHHAVGKQKYNETLTVFWLHIVALELQRLPAYSTLVDRCNSIIATLNNPKMPSEFYSDELLWSEQARNGFVEPDLKSWKQARIVQHRENRRS